MTTRAPYVNVLEHFLRRALVQMYTHRRGARCAHRPTAHHNRACYAPAVRHLYIVRLQLQAEVRDVPVTVRYRTTTNTSTHTHCNKSQIRHGLLPAYDSVQPQRRRTPQPWCWAAGKVCRFEAAPRDSPKWRSCGCGRAARAAASAVPYLPSACVKMRAFITRSARPAHVAILRTELLCCVGHVGRTDGQTDD
jgi:hypothetical protein